MFFCRFKFQSKRRVQLDFYYLKIVTFGCFFLYLVCRGGFCKCDPEVRPRGSRLWLRRRRRLRLAERRRAAHGRRRRLAPHVLRGDDGAGGREFIAVLGGDGATGGGRGGGGAPLGLRLPHSGPRRGATTHGGGAGRGAPCPRAENSTGGGGGGGPQRQPTGASEPHDERSASGGRMRAQLAAVAFFGLSGRTTRSNCRCRPFAP